MNRSAGACYSTDVQGSQATLGQAHGAMITAGRESRGFAAVRHLRIVASTSLLLLFSIPKTNKSAAAEASTAWLDPGWDYRRAIVIDNREGADLLSDYQIRVSVSEDSDMTLNTRDVRFTDADGVTLLNHWAETQAPEDPPEFWVNVPSIPAGTQSTIYMYYGNRNAPEVSNGPGTFLFFDDFEGAHFYPSIFGLLRGKSWIKEATNPILTKSSSGWDSYGLRDPMLLVDGSGYLVQENGTYVMYYRGNEYDPDFDGYPDHIRRQIGRAVSPDGINWTKDEENNPVLRLGAPGEWDDAFIGSAWAIKEGDHDYRLYYDAYDGSLSGIGIAASRDGIHWAKAERNPLLTAKDWAGISDSTTVVAILCALRRAQGDYVIFVEVGPPAKAIFGAISEDGTNFTALNTGQALMKGTEYAWDSYQVANPKVVEVSPGRYIMGYNGRGGLQHQLGFAYSTDLVHWEKYSENPVVFLGEPKSWDGGRVENAFIAKDDLGTSAVRMWYFGCPTSDGVQDCSIGYAVSPQDGAGGPLGWWAVYGDPQVSSDQAHSGLNAVKIDTSDAEYIRRFANHRGSFTLGFYLYYQSSQGRSSVMRLVDGSMTAIKMKYENGHLYYLEYGSWIDLGTVQAGTWHKIEVSADTRANRVVVLIDGTVAGEYRPSSGSISGLTYVDMAGASANAYFVDDVTIRRHCVPEPTCLVGNEMSRGSWLTAVALHEDHDAPTLLLAPAGPNPTSAAATLRFVLPRASKVQLAILDVAGRHVRTLLDRPVPAGTGTIAWDGRDDRGRLAPVGIYWVLMRSDDGHRTQKLALVR